MRLYNNPGVKAVRPEFPFLLGGTFIEATTAAIFAQLLCEVFPFLLGGTFIEAPGTAATGLAGADFPSFWEGLSLRRRYCPVFQEPHGISLPFGRDFH